MGFLIHKNSAMQNTQHWNGVMLNKSAYGDVIPVLIGPNRVPMKLIWAGDWKHTTTSAPGQHVGKGLGGGGGTTQDVFTEAMQSLLGYGPCDRIDSFWSASGRVGVLQTNVTATVPLGGGNVDVADTNYSGDMGVGAQVSYSQAVNDYGSPGPKTLSGTYYKPLTRGTVSAPGVYVISHPVVGVTRYTFNSADAGTPIIISYAANLAYVYNSTETPIPASPYQYTVPSTNTFWPSAATQVINVNTGNAFTQVSGAPAAGQFKVTGSSGSLGGGIFTFNAADAGTLVLIKWQSKDTSVDPNHAAISFTLANGASGQSPWSYLQSNHPADAGAVSYPNMALWEFAPLYLGTSNSVPQLSAEAVMNQYMAGGGLAGANPATVIKAILTDPVWGVGMDPSLLADWVTPAGSAFNFWAANNFYISLMEDTQTDALSVINRILDAGQAVMFWDQGQLQIAVYGDTSVAGNGVIYQPDTQPVVNFSVDDFVAAGGAQPVKVESEAQNNVFNRVKVQWMNALVDYRTEIIVEEDTASINQNGLHEEGQQNWEFIRYVQQAQWAANLRLRRLSNIRDTYTWTVPTRYRHLLKLLKLVTVTWAHMGWNNKALRITKIEEDHNGLALTMEEFPYGVAQAVLYPKLTAQAMNNNPALISPGNTDLVAFEVPDALNNYAGNVIRIYADPVTPNNWGGVNVYYSGDNVNFAPLGQINQSVMMGVLGGGQTASDSFIRANSNPIGGNWTTLPSLAALQLSNNAVTGTSTGAGGNAAYWNAYTPTNDQSSSVTITALNTNGDYVAAGVRMSATGNYYAAFAQGPLGPNATFFLQKMVAGAQTNFGPVVTTPIHAGDVITTEVVGNTVYGLINGAIVLQATDASLTSGSAGIVIFDSGAGGTVGGAAATSWNASSKNQGMSSGGTRVQSTGGSTTWKYFINVDTPSVNGAVYTVSCQVKNNGANNVYLGGNLSPVLSAPCAPGATAVLTFTCTGNGTSSAQFILYSQNAGDTVDVVLSNPFMSHTGSNQIAVNAQTFNPTMWGVGTGASVTVTQNTDPDNQTIQIVDTNSVALAQPSAFDFNNKNALLAIVDASGTFEIVAYQNVTLVAENVYNVQGFHRGLFGTTRAAHVAGCSVIQLASAFVEVQFSAAQVGQTFYFRAASFNKLQARLQDYTTLPSLSVPLGSAAPGLFTNGNLNSGHASADNISDGVGKSLTVASAVASAVPASNMRGLNLVSNPDFANGSVAFQVPGGTQNFSVYDNNATGGVSITPSTNIPNGAWPPYLPNTTGYALKIQHGYGFNETPGFGGFYLSILPDNGVSQVGAYHKGNTIIWRILAKIPKSCSIQFASNGYGNDGSASWVTTQQGQGDGNTGNPGAGGPYGYQTYLLKQKIGTYGTFSSTGFFYLYNTQFGGNQNYNIIPDSDNVGGTWTISGATNPFVYQGLFGPTGEWPGTWETTNPAGGAVTTYANSGIISVTPGQTYIVSAFVNCQAITAGNPLMQIWDVGIANNYLSYQFQPGAYGRYWVNWTCPGGVTQVKFLFHTNGATFSAGQYIQMGNPMIEVLDSHLPTYNNTNPSPTTYMPNPLVWWVAECSAIDVDVPQYTSDGYNLMRQGVSTSLNAQNSIMPGQTVAFTATQSPTSVGYSWGAQTLKRPDNSNLTLAAGSVNFTGLANSTLYYSYPYLTVSGNNAIMNWVQGGVGGGGAYTSGTQSSAVAMNAYLDGRFSLGAIHNTTQSAGGTGGGGGGGDPGGSCPSEDELAWVIRDSAAPVRMRMGDVRNGDEIKGWSFAEQKDVYRLVEGFRHLPTSMWHKVGGYHCSSCETVYLNGAWTQAYKVPSATKVRGHHKQRVEIQVEHNGFTGNEERNYWLDNGSDAPLLMHNFFPFC